MNADLLAKLKIGLKIAAALAKYTDTKLDDQAVAFVTLQVDNPFVQSLIGHLIAILDANPGISSEQAVMLLPPGVLSAAEHNTYGKFGDGKLIALLIKLLPIILAI